MLSKLAVVFWLDVTLLFSICALETVPVTGMIVHEWLGLALAGMIVLHLLLSWAWIASATRRLLAAQSNRTRINYFLNLCLFACVTAVIFSGILISQQAIPALTMQHAELLASDFPWTSIHDRFSDFVLILAALHLAINWNWSVAAVRKLLRRRSEGTP
jgi:cytochrome b